MSHSMLRKAGYLAVIVSLNPSFSHEVTAIMLVPIIKGMEKNFSLFLVK